MRTAYKPSSVYFYIDINQLMVKFKSRSNFQLESVEVRSIEPTEVVLESVLIIRYWPISIYNLPLNK